MSDPGSIPITFDFSQARGEVSSFYDFVRSQGESLVAQAAAAQAANPSTTPVFANATTQTATAVAAFQEQGGGPVSAEQQTLASGYIEGLIASLERQIEAGNSIAATMLRAQSAIDEFISAMVSESEELVANAIQARLNSAVAAQALAGSETYITATVAAAAAEQKLSATLQEALTASAAYTAATVRLTASQQELQAKVAEGLAGDDTYILSTARIAVAKQEQAAKVQELLAIDESYAAFTQRVTVARELQAAKVQENLATDGLYVVAQQRVTTAKEVQNARLQENLATDGLYLLAQQRVASAKQQQAAQLAEALSTDGLYLAAQARVSSAKQQQAAQVEETLATDALYLAAQARVSSAKQQQAAQLAEALGTDSLYLAAQARVSLAKQEQSARLQDTLNVDGLYAAAQARLSTAKQQQAAEVQEILTTDSLYAAAQARLGVAKQEQAAQLQEALTVDALYAAAQARVSSAKQQQAAQLAEALATDDLYLAAQARVSAAKQEQNARLQETLNADDLYVAAQARVSIAKQEQNARLQEALSVDDLYVAAQARVSAAKQEQAAQLQEALSADDLYTAAQARVSTAKQEQAAQLQEALAADDLYVSAQARVSAAKQEQAAQLQEILATDDLYVAAQERITVAKQEQSARLQAALATDDAYLEATVANRTAKQEQTTRLNTALAADELYIKATAALTVSKEKLKLILDTEVAAEREAAGLTAAEAGGRAPIPPLPPVAPVAPGEGGLTEGIGGRAVRLGQYAVIGAGIGAATIGIKDVISSANQLQVIFAQLQSQLAQTGQSQFLSEIKAKVDAIANSTGVAAPQIAAVMSELVGAFKSVPEALTYAQQAAEIARVTGKDMKTVVGDLTPTSLAFNQSFQSIADYAVKARNSFGTNIADLLQFFSTASPLVKQFGGNLNELAAIGGAALTHIGTAPTSVSEDLNRTLANFQKQLPTLTQVLTTGGAGSLAQEIAKSVSGGDITGAFATLIANYGSLKKVTQDQVDTTVGSTRAVKDYAAVGLAAGQVNQFLGNSTNQAGLFAQVFGEQQKTLQQKLGELGQQALTTGRHLFNDGLGAALVELLQVVGGGLKVLEALANVFGDIDHALGGIPDKLLLVGGALAGLHALGGTAFGQRVNTALGGGGGGDQEQSLAQQRYTLAQQRYQLARQRYEIAQLQYEQDLKQYNLDQDRLAGKATEGEATLAEKNGITSATEARTLEATEIGNANEALQSSALARNAENDANLSLVGRLGQVGGAVSRFVGGLGGLALALTTVFALIQKWSQEHSDAAAAGAATKANALAALNAGLTVDQVRAQEHSPSIKDTLGAAFGVAPDNRAKTEEGIQQFQGQQAGSNGLSVDDQLQALAGIGVKVPVTNDIVSSLPNRRNISGDYDHPALTMKGLQDLADSVQSGADGALDGGKKLLDYIQTKFPALYGVIETRAKEANAVAAQTRASQADTAGYLQTLSEAPQTVSEIVSAYKSGQISLGDAVTKLQAQLSLLRSAEGSGPTGLKNYLDAQNQLNDIISNSVKTEADLLVKVQDFQGGDQTQADLQILEAALNNPKLTSASDRQALVDQILSLLQKEANTLKQTLGIPIEAQAEIEAQLVENDAQWSQVLTSFGLNEQAIITIAEAATKAHESFNKAFYDFETNALKLEDTIIGLILKDPFLTDEARALLQQQVVNNYLHAQELAALAGQLPDINAPTTVSPGASSATNPDTTLAQRLALHKAEAEYNAAVAGNSPTAQAQSEMDQAEADLKDAQDRLNQNPNDLVAQADYWKARTEELKGQQDMAKAAVGILDAQYDYYSALAKFKGDDVGAAQDQLNKALADLAKAPSEGIKPGSAAYTQLQTNVTNAQADARDAALSQREDQINFEEQMGQITAGQAAALYQQLLTIPTLTTKEREDIQLKIHDLLKSSDLQYNLPSDINLPTLYEARRLNQTPTGSAYSGAPLNQNQFTFYVTGATLGQVTQAVSQAVGAGANVFGAVPRRY